MYSNQVVELGELPASMIDVYDLINLIFSSALDSVGGRTIIFRFFICLDCIDGAKPLDIRV